MKEHAPPMSQYLGNDDHDFSSPVMMMLGTSLGINIMGIVLNLVLILLWFKLEGELKHLIDFLLTIPIVVVNLLSSIALAVHSAYGLVRGGPVGSGIRCDIQGFINVAAYLVVWGSLALTAYARLWVIRGSSSRKRVSPSNTAGIPGSLREKKILGQLAAAALTSRPTKIKNTFTFSMQNKIYMLEVCVVLIALVTASIPYLHESHSGYTLRKGGAFCFLNIRKSVTTSRTQDAPSADDSAHANRIGNLEIRKEIFIPQTIAAVLFVAQSVLYRFVFVICYIIVVSHVRKVSKTASRNDSSRSNTKSEISNTNAEKPQGQATANPTSLHGVYVSALSETTTSTSSTASIFTRTESNAGPTQDTTDRLENVTARPQASAKVVTEIRNSQQHQLKTSTMASCKTRRAQPRHIRDSHRMHTLVCRRIIHIMLAQVLLELPFFLGTLGYLIIGALSARASGAAAVEAANPTLNEDVRAREAYNATFIVYQLVVVVQPILILVFDSRVRKHARKIFGTNSGPWNFGSSGNAGDAGYLRRRSGEP